MVAVCRIRSLQDRESFELLNLRRGKPGRSQGFRPLVVLTMALVVDDVAEMVLDMKPLSTSDGRFPLGQLLVSSSRFTMWRFGLFQRGRR